MSDKRIPFYYVSDKCKFYDAINPGKLVTTETASKRLMEYDYCQNDIEALQMLASIKLAPITEQQCELLRNSKPKKEPLDWQLLYEEMQKLFPFYSRLSSKGERQIYFVTANNEASLVHYEDDDSLINSLMYANKVYAALKDFYNTSTLLEEHRNKVSLRTFLIRIIKEHLLMDSAKVIAEQPVNFSWDTSVLAFKQFDASLVALGDTPTWDEFINRITYPDIFMAWVWSLFEPTNNIRQALWLTGAGNDGKSAVQKALRQIFGPQHVYDCKKNDETQPWFQANIFGKSLVNYADCDNPFLLTHQGIKQLTGGDATSIEGKGIAAFSAEVYAKMFITSNMPPKINPDLEAQTSRLVRLKIAPIAKGGPKDEQFKTRLVAEAWPFLYKCREAYGNYINTGNDALILPAALSNEIINECAEEDYYIVQDFTKKFVEFGPEFNCTPSDLNGTLLKFVTQDLNYDSQKLKYIRIKFQVKLELKGIRMQPIMIKNEETLAYVGFRLTRVFYSENGVKK